MHIEMADRATANLTSTFQATTGPNAAVIGEMRNPRARIEAFQPAFCPTG